MSHIALAVWINEDLAPMWLLLYVRVHYLYTPTESRMAAVTHLCYLITALHKCWISHVVKDMRCKGILLIHYWGWEVTLLLLTWRCVTLYMLIAKIYCLMLYSKWLTFLTTYCLLYWLCGFRNVNMRWKIFRWKVVSAGSGASFFPVATHEQLRALSKVKCCNMSNTTHPIIKAGIFFNKQ